MDGILTSHAVILIQLTVSSAHALKREHLVPLYANILASVRNKTWKFVWVVPESGIGEAFVRQTFDGGEISPDTIFLEPFPV